MSDEPKEHGPGPMVIDPGNPRRAIQPVVVEPSPLSPVAQQIEDHMQSSEFAGADPSGDPFLAGFQAALAHLRALFSRL